MGRWGCFCCKKSPKRLEIIYSYICVGGGEISRFVSIEGGEGVGKSLFINHLADDLTARRIPFIKTREPGGTPSADLIRGLFGAPPADDPFCMMTEALLISAARAQHVEKVIRPALKSRTWVICDRYADSTRVYQGIIGGVPASEIESVIAISTGRLTPDVTFLLDCDVELAASRRQQRGGQDDAIKRYDDKKLEFHERLRQGYLTLAKQFPERFKVIDASQNPPAVAAEAIKTLVVRFGL